MGSIHFYIVQRGAFVRVVRINPVGYDFVCFHDFVIPLNLLLKAIAMPMVLHWDSESPGFVDQLINFIDVLFGVKHPFEGHRAQLTILVDSSLVHYHIGEDLPELISCLLSNCVVILTPFVLVLERKQRNT
tara:strand:- start:418 stop:810 length:393 start_codon:yes stop_codon:yes gene_type:complete